MSEMLLKHNLKTLRLPRGGFASRTMLAEHTRLSREASDGNQSYDDYLLKLTVLEVVQRAGDPDQKYLLPGTQRSGDF